MVLKTLVLVAAVLCTSHDVAVRVDNQSPCAARVQVLEGQKEIGRVEVGAISKANLRVTVTDGFVPRFIVRPGAGCNVQEPWVVPSYAGPEATRLVVQIGTFQQTSSVRAAPR